MKIAIELSGNQAFNLLVPPCFHKFKEENVRAIRGMAPVVLWLSQADESRKFYGRLDQESSTNKLSPYHFLGHRAALPH